MNESGDLQRMHGGVLSSISFDWGEGVARILVDLSTVPMETMEAVAYGSAMLVCPRRNPSGPSRYVHEARMKASAGGSRSMILELEMQSGDVIQVEAEQFWIRTIGADGMGPEPS